MPNQSVAQCLRAMRGHTVDVVHHAESGTASYGGLVTCGSVWHCPVCSAKISERRKVELREAIDEAERAGLRVLLVTYTIRHKRADCIETSVEGLLKARRASKSGRWAKDFNARYGVVGSVRALEVTHGGNGWHPHLHELLFVSGDTDPAEVLEVLRARWAGMVGRAGLRDVNEHGVDVQLADEAVSEYVAKFGSDRSWGPEAELAKAVRKRGRGESRTPVDLLCDYGAGDAQAGRLWQVYARAFKGKRQLAWSRGLRDALGLKAEQTDEEVAAEETAEGVQLAVLERHEWAAVVGNDLRGELLAVAAAGDGPELERWLWKHGIRRSCLSSESTTDDSEETQC